MLKPAYLYYYIATLLAGLALIIFNSTAKIYEIIVFIIGAIVFISSGYILLTSLFPGKKIKETGVKTSPIVWGPITGGIIFGILLMAVPGFFVTYLIYTFGVLLVICGIIQLASVSGGMRHLELSGWFLAIPILAIVIGIAIILSGPQEAKNIVMILSGAVLACYGLNGITDYIKRTSLGKKHLPAPSRSREDSEQ